MRKLTIGIIALILLVSAISATWAVNAPQNLVSIVASSDKVKVGDLKVAVEYTAKWAVDKGFTVYQKQDDVDAARGIVCPGSFGEPGEGWNAPLIAIGKKLGTPFTIGVCPETWSSKHGISRPKAGCDLTIMVVNVDTGKSAMFQYTTSSTSDTNGVAPVTAAGGALMATAVIKDFDVVHHCWHHFGMIAMHHGHRCLVLDKGFRDAGWYIIAASILSNVLESENGKRHGEIHNAINALSGPLFAAIPMLATPGDPVAQAPAAPAPVVAAATQ